MANKFVNFLKESYGELRKVSWPAKEDAVSSSVVVIVFIVFFALFLALIDYVVNMVVMGLVR